jgi:protein tyrosine phosphatase (PTP) superfamily phosphohydrolase (DUF442 family)
MTPFDAVSGITNACQATPTLITGGQPSAEQLAAFKKSGGAVVLDIRDPMEARPFSESATVQELGLEYVNVPVISGQLNDQAIDRILEVLRTNKEKQVLFHCASANRVGGALVAYLMLDLGMDEEAATERAMQVGLRNAGYLQTALEYVAAHSD